VVHRDREHVLDQAPLPAPGAPLPGALVLPAVGGVVAVIVILLTLVPGTDISLLWPAEYIILLVWVALGALIYAIAPKERDEQALKALLGDQYGKIGEESGEVEPTASGRAP
jgi:basic amino acid/polyamine antiporter, APA family